VLPSLNTLIGPFRERILMVLMSLYLTTTLLRTWGKENIVSRILHRFDTRYSLVMRFISRPVVSRRYKFRYPAQQGAQSGPITGLDALEEIEEPTTETPTKQITKFSIQQRRRL